MIISQSEYQKAFKFGLKIKEMVSRENMHNQKVRELSVDFKAMCDMQFSRKLDDLINLKIAGEPHDFVFRACIYKSESCNEIFSDAIVYAFANLNARSISFNSSNIGNLYNEFPDIITKSETEFNIRVMGELKNDQITLFDSCETFTYSDGKIDRDFIIINVIIPLSSP